MSNVTVRKRGRTLLLRNALIDISMNLTDGSWSCVDNETGALMIRDARFRVDKSGNEVWAEPDTTIAWSRRTSSSALGRGTTVTLTFTPQAGYEPIRMLTLRLYPDRPFVELGWGIRNPFKRRIRVQNVEVVYGGELFVDQRVDQPRSLKSGAGAEPNPIEKDWEIEADNGAMVTYRDGAVRRTMVAGGLAYGEFARRAEFMNGERQWRNRGTAEITRHGFRNLNLTCWDPQGKVVPPETTYWSPDTSYLDVVTADPFEALEAYGMALRAANDAAPNVYDFPTLCGWMVSTRKLGEGAPINNSPGLVEQAKIARDCGFMKYSPLAVRLEPDTYCRGYYGNTQQGWWDDAHWRTYGPGAGHAPDESRGSLRKPYDSFPKFCKAVADLGAIPFTYFQSSMPSNDFAEAHPEWMLGNDVSRLHVHHAHHRPLVRYDYTDPGFRKHCLEVWKRLRKAGLKGVKFDYPETAWARDGGFEDDSFTTTSAYCELFRLCREGLGDDAFIHERILGGDTHEDVPRLDATAGTVDLQRIWGDSSHFEPGMASRMGLRWYKSRSVFLYYPDGKSFYANGEALPAHRRRAFLTLIAFLGGRLEIGTSIGRMTDEMFHDVTRLYPVFRGTRSPRPVDMLLGKTHPEVYLYAVTDEWHQVLLVNNNERRKKVVSAPISGDQAQDGALGLDPDATYHAFDFWSQCYVGLLKGSDSIEMQLRGGEVAMVSLRRALDRPQVVSTNRHLMQGMVECHDVKWSPKKKTMSGAVDVVGGEDFVLTIAINGADVIDCRGATVRKRKGERDVVDLVFRSEVNNTMTFVLTCR